MVNDLPQITDRAEMEEALKGSKKVYAVLNAPVYASPVDDAFDILADEHFYIRYFGEVIKESVNYTDDMGTMSYYRWEEGDEYEVMAEDTLLYNAVPIDLTGCLVEKPDHLSSEELVKPFEGSENYFEYDTGYYYPDGKEKGDPNNLGENKGLTRYSVSFLSSGTDLSFIAWVGDNEVSIYSNESLDDIYVRAAAVQHGELSDLSWQVESGYAGSSFLTWIFCLLIIFVINYPVNNDDDNEEKPKKNRNGKKKRRK